MEEGVEGFMKGEEKVSFQDVDMNFCRTTEEITFDLIGCCLPTKTVVKKIQNKVSLSLSQHGLGYEHIFQRFISETKGIFA